MLTILYNFLRWSCVPHSGRTLASRSILLHISLEGFAWALLCLLWQSVDVGTWAAQTALFRTLTNRVIRLAANFRNRICRFSLSVKSIWGGINRSVVGTSCFWAAHGLLTGSWAIKCATSRSGDHRRRFISATGINSTASSRCCLACSVYLPGSSAVGNLVEAVRALRWFHFGRTQDCRL